MITLKQKLNEMNENGKPSTWRSDLQLLADYLKMDSEINVAIQQSVVPNFKSLTYIIHDKAKFIPAAEGLSDDTFTSVEILGEAVKLLLQKKK